jgi:hypothetical protein
MLTYRQYLNEGLDLPSYRHVATKRLFLGQHTVYKGDVYYTTSSEDETSYDRQKASLHRIDGPALTYTDVGVHVWVVDGENIGKDTPNSIRWLLLKASIENNFEILNKIGMTKEMQEYVCHKRPDLVVKIQELDPELVKKYKYEKELGNVDL